MAAVRIAYAVLVLFESTTAYTPSDYGYQHLWIAMEERSNIAFQVRACSDVHIALSMFESDVSDFTTEIVIGGWHNSRSLLRNLFSAGSWFSADTPQILHCNEFRYFWISWANAYVEVGRGPTVGKQKFLNYKFRSLHVINGVGFSSGYGYTGTWRLTSNSGNTIIQRTPLDGKYQYMWRSVVEREFISFSVAACENARIVLSELEGNIRFNTWEVIIGGESNTKTFIKSSPLDPDPRNRDVKHTPALSAVVITRQILSCNETRLFWIGWAGGYVQVGRGMYYGQELLVSLDDRNNSHAVNSLSVATSTSTGRWLFNDNIVGTTTVFTPPDRNYNSMWLESVRYKFLTFYVRACSDAKIYLSAERGVSGDFTLVVVLGAESNTVSGLQEAINLGWRFRMNTPRILSCNDSRPFWISWDNSTIRLGRGAYNIKQTEIFSYPAWKDHPIGAVSFRTNAPVNGEWNVKKNMGEVMSFYTDKDGGQKYTRMWRSVANQKFVSFTVKACNDAHILLTKSQGKTDGDLYEVVIGGYKNRRSFIREKIAGPNMALVNSSGLLNCSEERPFWVGWVNGIVKAGRGYRYNRGTFIKYRDPNPFPVASMSISTGYGSYGDWKFEEFISEKAILYTPSTDSVSTKYITTTTTSLQFDVRACSDARLKLSEMEVEDGGTTQFYTITVGGQGNSKCSISKNNQLMHEVPCDRLLSCETTRSFWVSWDKGNVILGLGKAGFRPIVSYQDMAGGVNVRKVFFSTVQGNDGNWIINEEAGNTLLYDTPQQWTNYNNRLWITTMEKEYLIFSVRACNQVFVLLSSLLGTPTRFAYEVVLGGWRGRRSVIRQRGWTGGAHHAENFEPVLSCTEYRPFWVSWAGGHIMVGKGKLVGQNRFMDWLDMSPHRVTALAFSTGYGTSGIWSFDIAKGLEPTNPPITERPQVTNPPPTQGRTPPRGLSPGAKAGIAVSVIIIVAIIGVVVLMIVRPGVRDKAAESARALIERARNRSAMQRMEDPNADQSTLAP